MTKILLFGKHREDIGQESIDLAGFETGSVADLRAALAASAYGQSVSFVSGKTLVAVNQTLATDAHLISPGDEVALFPPVTGG